ncbi:hypothetical protein IV203_036357 [Nitzschia inconspicua]|uniref:WRKY19-like zinc finger domain-containing protein n=1 Tax=Nitzschia inconspicua TaxID=303405 RepID=A0A9K3PVF7_9STRA|nr:hypothetical protein IV203_036357 [Nitzschia inconspicua]
MDPDRVRAYLQVACAGLGFDIGEVWWTHNDNGSSSALAAIEEKDDSGSALVSQNKRLRFVQLYTSKSYENRRNMLVRPADEEENYKSKVNGEDIPDEDSASSLKKHVLSPTLVDAISKTAQVVWAHTRKSEGLTGRSEMRLQTAVGMPVAVDREGNMCVVVMFSPNNISSTDDAMEYLQSISRSATSSSIPSLLPAFDPKQGLISLPHHHHSTNDVLPMLNNVLSEGVTTRFVSLDENPTENHQLAIPEVHSDHDLGSAPRDCFGIPMLPAVAELGSSTPNRSEEYGETVTDAFDEASYGVWSTIMQTFDNPNVLSDDSPPDQENNVEPVTITELGNSESYFDTNDTVATITKPAMAIERQERLDEFASAFLEVSVFDLAEVWLPLGRGSDALGLVTSVTSTNSNYPLNDFTLESEKCLIKYWSGAVGRAYSSGNPVWSFNRNVFADSGRLRLFEQAKIETALAVPVFSGKSNSPAFVFCCYSFVRTGSVPFVLKFVQQALKLLWGGLDKVQPHASVGEDLWRDVAPADLGEMAADVEMQQHFMIKKRPIGAISNEPHERNDVDDDLAVQIETLEGPSGTPTASSIYTGRGASSDYGTSGDQYHEEIFPSTIQPIQYQTFESVQTHIQNAIKSVADMQPAHQHVATNASGSKRAHVFHQESSQVSYLQPVQQQQQQMYSQSQLVSQQQQYQQQPYQQQQQQQQQQPTNMAQTNFVQNQQGYGQSSQTFLSQSFSTLQPQQFKGQQSYTGATSSCSNVNNNGFLPVVSAPLPLGRPLPLPNQVINSQSSYGTHMKRNSSDSVNDLLQDPSLLQPTPKFEPTPIPDRMMDTFHLETTMHQQTQLPPQQNVQQPYGNNAFAASPPSTMAHPEPSPILVYSVPVDQLSQNGMTFAPIPAQVQKNPSGTSDTPAFCVPTSKQATVTNGKCCRIQGCRDPAVPRRPYCVRHSGNRTCEHEGCGKCAQGSTRFCIAHGGGRRCTHPGCDKGARDKFFCAAHGGGKRCRYDGCNKSAVGGSSLCTAHGGGRRCAVEGCDKSAQSSTKFCVKHGGGKKCSHPDCEKVARGRTQYCAAHGGGVRCKLAGCNRVAIGKLQLCRAHGGGARPKGSSHSSSDEGETPQQEIQERRSLQQMGASMAPLMFGAPNKTFAHI